MTDPRAAHAIGVLQTAAAAHQRMAVDVGAVVQAADVLTRAIGAGRTVFAFGNGGSAADAQHFVAELVGRYEPASMRQAWPAVALSADTSVLTAVGNDFGFERVFARQIEALGRPGDIALGITTSGRSPNVLRGFDAARANGLVTVALIGRGGDLEGRVDVLVTVPEDRTARIQEVHITLLHILCELVEDGLNG